MRGSLQQRLLRHEELPPPTAWNEISRRMDEEFNSTDSAISVKLEDAFIPPPPAAWDNIQMQLENSSAPEVGKKGKIIPLIYRRAAVAATIAAVLAIAVMYFFTGNTGFQDRSRSRNNDLVQQPLPSSDTETVNSRPPVIVKKDTPSPKKNLIASNNSGTREPRRRTRSISREPSIIQESFENDIEEANLYTPHTVSNVEPISVSAPPIRDGDGNIIMDLDVIREPGQQYITVTSPNGNPTRISNKFLDCLRYINANLSSSEMDDDAVECKERFEEWRRKILSDGSFIPAAGNFFDIFEMKEMIQD